MIALRGNDKAHTSVDLFSGRLAAIIARLFDMRGNRSSLHTTLGTLAAELERPKHFYSIVSRFLNWFNCQTNPMS